MDEPVGKAEFSRILLHLAQRRGFKSNRRTASDGEDGRLLAAVNENRRRMAQGGWRTVGEMLYRHEAFALHKRNKADDYLSTVGRDMVAEEASILFERQRELCLLYTSAAGHRALGRLRRVLRRYVLSIVFRLFFHLCLPGYRCCQRARASRANGRTRA